MGSLHQTINRVTCNRFDHYIHSLLYRVRQKLGLEVCSTVFVEVPLPIFFLPGSTAAVVWPTGLGNFDQTLRQSYCNTLYRVTKVLGDTDYVDIKMRVASF